ncbi:hypothetical protein AB0K11_04120 [Mycobacterium sp. NPDC050551]|uniref:Rv1733c family protein n=1 Tax=Mycobacterium sp. NPDC050551 TaxID=3155407 RepID=UPI003420BEE3
MAVLVLAVLSFGFIAIAGAVGTDVYDTKSREYADEAKSSHLLTATVVEDSRVVVLPNSLAHVAAVRWNAAGSNHTDDIPSPRRLKSGETVTIWVDARGDRIQGPPTNERAAGEAIGIAVLLWFGVLGVAGVTLLVLHRRLDTVRCARWERELETLTDDGGRASRRP